MQAVRDHQERIKSTSASPLGKTLGVKGSLSRTLLQVQQHRSKLETFEKFQGEHFEDLMRQHAANPKAIDMELHLQRYADVCSCLTIPFTSVSASTSSCDVPMCETTMCDGFMDLTHTSRLSSACSTENLQESPVLK
jgi:hypothetical protein